MKSSYLHRQYIKLQRRIARINFHRLNREKQEQLQRRLIRYEQQLYDLTDSPSLLNKQFFKTTIIGVGILATIPMIAQTFTEITSPASPFVYLPINPTTPYGMPILGNAVLSMVDIDGDGDFDAFAGQSNGSISFIENIGSTSVPNFSLSSSSEPFDLSDVGRHSAPSLVDIDRDGDLDAFVGEEDGNINYFENIGSSSLPNFSLSSSSEPFGLSDIGEYSNTLVCRYR